MISNPARHEALRLTSFHSTHLKDEK